MSFFPLDIGNEWHYTDNRYNSSERIIDTTRINGVLYYGLAMWSNAEPVHWLRYDIVYILNSEDTTEYILYNFKADVGSSWELPVTYTYICEFGDQITLTSKNDTIVTPAGTFFNCYRFTHKPRCDDAGMIGSWFYKGVGKIRFITVNFFGEIDYKLASYQIKSSPNSSAYPGNRYFPMHIGNSWTYHDVWDERIKSTVYILDSTRVNEDLCYYYGADKNLAQLLFPDSLGNIWQYDKNNQKKLWRGIDFTIIDQDSYFYEEDNDVNNYVVKIYRNIERETIFGILDSCIVFSFDDPEAIDEEHSYTFAPGIGIIFEHLGMGIMYQLESAIINGKIMTGIKTNKRKNPSGFALLQNYPNPFNPSTMLTYDLPVNGYVVIKIYALTGRLVKVIANGNQPAGSHQIRWDGTDFRDDPATTGVYICRLEFASANGQKLTKSIKLSLIR